MIFKSQVELSSDLGRTELGRRECYALEIRRQPEASFVTGYPHRHRVWTWMDTVPCALESLKVHQPRVLPQRHAYLKSRPIHADSTPILTRSGRHAFEMALLAEWC